jgi:uncharacterized alpha-E superfamily protein
MLSRVAENLYWMVRYLERVEDTARLINTTTHLQLDLPRGATFGWDVLLKVAGVDRQFRESHPRADEASIMHFLIGDERNSSSIVSCIRSARENCRTLREVLPPLAWERINGLYLFVEHTVTDVLGRTRRYNVLNEVIERRHSVVGLLSGTMSHDVAYQFIRLGRHIERADMTTRIVDITSAVLLSQPQNDEDPFVEQLWMGVLRAFDAYQVYRRQVSVRVQGAEVVNFLIKDPRYPRTVCCCLASIERCLQALPRNAAALELLRAAQKRVAELQAETLSTQARHEYLDAVQADLASVDQEIARQYFHWDDARLIAAAVG